LGEVETVFNPKRAAVAGSFPASSPATATLAIVFALRYDIATSAKTDHPTTSGAVSWFEGGRIFEFLEIVFVSAIPNVHLGRERFETLLAILPATFVLFIEVRAAQSEAVVIAVTRVALVRKDNVIRGIIANHVVTARRTCQRFAPGAAQATCLLRSRWRFRHAKAFLKW
jgi:hypothetical protein